VAAFMFQSIDLFSKKLPILNKRLFSSHSQSGHWHEEENLFFHKEMKTSLLAYNQLLTN
jgi:hypothetical protein